MSFSFGMSPWLLAASLLAAGAAAVWLYRHTMPALPRSKRIVLGVLRFCALFFILLLLLEPVFRLVRHDEKEPVVAVLIDDSASLRLASGTDTSRAVAQAHIRDILQHIPPAARGADVRYIRFGSDLDAGELPRFEPDSLALNAFRTNIAQALASTEERLRDDNLRAVLLVSDGRYNTGRNPLYVSERYPVPVFTAVVGDTLRRQDIRVQRVLTNEVAYVGAELPIEVGIRAEGMGGRRITVSLAVDGETITSQALEIPPGNAEIVVDLSVTPESEGLRRYTVAITELPDEVTHRNNRESLTVRVLSSKRRILLVAAAPGPDVAAIRRLLARNAAFEVSPFVQKSAGAFYEGGFPSSLADFDVIVLAGYPGRVSDGTVLRRIGEAAQEGVPVFFLLTSATSIPRLGIISEDVLPVEPGRVREDFMEAAFQPAPAGNHHPIMHISGGDPEAWSTLPPLEYSRTQWALTPDAQVLATVSVRGIDLSEPLLVVRRRTQHRTAALLGAGTWRWQNLPEDLSDFEQLPAELFANIIQWLTALEDDRPVRIYPVRDVFGGGESVQFSGQVYDESLNPVPDASVEIRLISPDGVEFPYLMQAIGSGRYTLNTGALPEGAYAWSATAHRGEEILGSDRGEFVVGSLTLEYREPGADVTLMRQVAQRSGGVLLDQSRPGPFTEVLSTHLEGASDTISQTTEEDLRKHPALLLFIIALLAAEWFFRKRNGMV
ncbi:MAG: hypothetical protein F4Y00_08405 [Bacteroidetes bacterium SB0662_bin_6]|nr:hypothetical protein [Bacteroidetes bacterium SB0668_bin_1]MYE04974.1 hypothetical protein [Bacteroidetes bacterium SB0662_bin_6]